MSRVLALACALSAAASAALAQADHHHHHPPEAPAEPRPDVPETPPPTPTDDLAELFHDPVQMAAARRVLRAEHGGARHARILIERLESRPSAGADGYGWAGAFRYGGDVERLVLTTEGEGARGHGLEAAEVQALYARAIDPYFDLRAGIRQDLQAGPSRTHATVGVSGTAPYWIEVDAAAFLSDKGRLSARVEVAYDLRVTQRLILQPSAEATLAASADRARGEGAGLTELEAGLRLRYEITRHFAPYVGVHRARTFGVTAANARRSGERAGDTRVVAGLRSWF